MLISLSVSLGLEAAEVTPTQGGSAPTHPAPPADATAWFESGRKSESEEEEQAGCSSLRARSLLSPGSAPVGFIGTCSGAGGESRPPRFEAPLSCFSDPCKEPSPPEVWSDKGNRSNTCVLRTPAGSTQSLRVTVPDREGVCDPACHHDVSRAHVFPGFVHLREANWI